MTLNELREKAINIIINELNKIKLPKEDVYKMIGKDSPIFNEIIINSDDNSVERRHAQF